MGWWYAGILFCTKRLFINRMKKICNNQFLQGEMLDAWTFIYCGFMDKWISYLKQCCLPYLIYKIFIINWKTSKTAGMDGYTSGIVFDGNTFNDMDHIYKCLFVQNDRRTNVVWQYDFLPDFFIYYYLFSLQKTKRIFQLYLNR